MVRKLIVVLAVASAVALLAVPSDPGQAHAKARSQPRRAWSSSALLSRVTAPTIPVA